MKSPCALGMQLSNFSVPIVCFSPTYLYFLHSLINVFSLAILCCVRSTDHARRGYMTTVDLIIGGSSQVSAEISLLAVTDVSLTVPRHSDSSLCRL